MAPQLSVIVPVLDGQQHLRDCLESIAAQSLGDLEAVLVDGGSTDGSLAVAAEFAAADPRFRLMPGSAGGLGGARHAGVRHGDPQSRYLAFADGDDVLPRDAYRYLHAALEESGSDFATGNVHRLHADRRVPERQYAHLTRTRLRTRVAEDQRLLTDRIAGNKLFRRAFWERHAQAFPEEALHQDFALTIPAHVLAEAVDVVHRPVCYRRAGDGVQGPVDVRGMADRIRAVERTSGFLGTRSFEHQRAFDLAALSRDLPTLMNALPQAGPDYREEFLEAAAAFAGKLDSSLFAELPVGLRAAWQLIRERRLPDLVALLDAERRNPRSFSVAGTVRRRAVFRAADGRGIALRREVTALRPAELPPVVRLEDAVWAKGRLHLHGYAYIGNLPAASALSSLRAAVLRSPGRRILLLPATSAASPGAVRDDGQDLHDRSRAGFRITVDPRRLRTGAPPQAGRRGRWTLGLALTSAGVLRYAGISPAAGDVGHTRVWALDGTTLLRLSFVQDVAQLTVEDVRARVDAHRLVDGFLELTGAVRDDLAPEALRLRQDGTDAALTCGVRLHEAADGWRGFVARVPLEALGQIPWAAAEAPEQARPGTDSWRAQLVLADEGGTVAPVALPGLGAASHPLASRAGGASSADAPGSSAELFVSAGPEGQLLVERTSRPTVDRLAWTPCGGLDLGGLLPRDAGPRELVLRHSVFLEERLMPVEQADGRFRVSLTPGAVPSLRGELPLREGEWGGFLRPAGASGRDGEEPLRLATSLHADLPAVSCAGPSGGRAFGVVRRHRDRFVLTSGSALPAGERGPYRARELRERRYPQARRRPLRDAVLYSSFDGRQYADSPRAVHEELVRRNPELEHVWVVADEQAALPPSVRAVALGSAAWHDRLADCRYLVTNTALPDWFRRRDGQIVLQTWHGVPVKRIGRALQGSVHADHGRLAALAEQSRQWSLLLSANLGGVATLRQALAYEGEILSDCSPRTDLLHAEDRAKIAEELRCRLGLAEHKRIVLYAPTFRDHLVLPGGPTRYSTSDTLDLSGLARSLGDRHTFLVRRHPDAVARFPVGADVLDVSYHPDATELLLLADILVTDYSSLAVDFCRTGKPVLFFTPDLEHYRDSVRGLALDLVKQAPGPLLRTAAELADALRDVDRVAAAHAERYASFREAHCGALDAEGARRAVDRLLTLT